MCMFSLILILIDWYNAWNEPTERELTCTCDNVVCISLTRNLSIAIRVIIKFLIKSQQTNCYREKPILWAFPLYFPK